MTLRLRQRDKLRFVKHSHSQFSRLTQLGARVSADDYEICLAADRRADASTANYDQMLDLVARHRLERARHDDALVAQRTVASRRFDRRNLKDVRETLHRRAISRLV